MSVNGRRAEHIVSFRVSKDEKALLYEQAEKSGINLSQLLRRKLDLLSSSTLRS